MTSRDLTSGVPAADKNAVSIEARQYEPLASEELAEDDEQQARGFRDWLGAAHSARTRILIAYVLLLALAAILAVLGFRQFLFYRLEDRAESALRQEVLELDQLLADGRDPATGRPFTTLEALFDTYFSRNVPSDEEAFLGFVEGELYRSSTLARFPLDRLPTEELPEWERLASRELGEERSANGTIDTSLGEAYFRAERIRFEGDVGAFVVTILPADERRAIGDFLTYGGAAALAGLLLASAFAWLIAGRALEPVSQLTETARSISRSDLTRRIEVRGTGEAAEMARSFNAMLDRLESVFQSQREFVQDASHELRDPLTIVRGHVQLLEDDPDERRRAIQLVTDELDRMGTIVDDLRLLAEADQPGFLRLEWIDLEAFTQELHSKASALAARRLVVDEAADGTLFADRHRLTQAAMNLAHNAVQHTAESDTIAISSTLHDGLVRIAVRDTGTGITRSDQAVIFDRFTRGTGAHVRYGGSGLGLAIVKAIADAHDGSVELASRLGQGSTFTIVVPRDAREGGAGGQDPDR